MASKTSLTKPSVSSEARARPLNWNGNLPMRTSWPASRAAFSVRPDAGDARVGVGAAGDRRVVDRAVGEAAEPLDAADRLVVRDVGQPGRADHVADRVDARHARHVAVLGVGLDVVLDDLDLQVVGEEALDVAEHADGHQHHSASTTVFPLGVSISALTPLSVFSTLVVFEPV